MNAETADGDGGSPDQAAGQGPDQPAGQGPDQGAGQGSDQGAGKVVGHRDGPVGDSVFGWSASGSPDIRRYYRSFVMHIWWLAALVGAAGFAIAWLATPHDREIESAWQLVVKLIAFGCLCCAIAFFPWISRRGMHWLPLVPFFFFTGYVLPRISWFYYGDVDRAQDGSFYTHLYLLLYPGIVLTVAAAYRLGGGTPGRCLKIAFGGMLIVFSGFLDVMWFVVNPVDLPKVIDAPHISLLTGGPISFAAAIAFALAHAPILVAINVLPLDRWLRRLLTTGEPPSEPAPEPASEPASR